MTSTDRDDERQRILDASRRLLSGTPQRGDGKLTVSNLAIEAGLSRQRLYEHHSDLVSTFKAEAGSGPFAPDIEALRRQLDDTHDRIRELEVRETAYLDQIKTLSAVITELTHQAHADNLVILPASGHSRSRR